MFTSRRFVTGAAVLVAILLATLGVTLIRFAHANQHLEQEMLKEAQQYRAERQQQREAQHKAYLAAKAEEKRAAVRVQQAWDEVQAAGQELEDNFARSRETWRGFDADQRRRLQQARGF